MKDAKSGSVKSATRALDIIEYSVSCSGHFTAQDLADTLKIPLSSMSYLLATLVDREYLLRDGRRYMRGPAIERLAVEPGSLSPLERAIPLVRSVRNKLNESTAYFERIGWGAEVLVTEAGGHALRYALEPNAKVPLFALAAGKVMLAQLEPEDLDAYFREEKREAFTAHTIVDEEELRRQIDEVRETGIARSSEEFTSGITAVACALGKDGALSVAIPLARFDEAAEQRAIGALKDAVAQFKGA